MSFTLKSLELPEGVKQLSTRLKQQWVDVYNAAEIGGDAHAAAVTKANAVIKGYFSWDAEYHRVSQEEADYSTYGASGGKGCASCQFFMSPDTCLIVSGDVSPTGNSRFYTPKVVYVAPPIDVRVVKSAGLLEKIGSAFKSLLPVAPPGLAVSALPGAGSGGRSSFQVVKTVEGYKWLAIYSNNFEDREHETISEAAHKEYVAWADSVDSDLLPELHYYHGGPLSRWGKTTLVDYVDGFAVACGTVDKDREFVAEALQDKEHEVSHGFFGLKNMDGVYGVIRPFEISPLPVGDAANVLTWVELHNKEFSMPFSEKKKAALVAAGFDAATVTQMEANMKSMGDAAVKSGINYKADGGVEDVVITAPVVEPPAPVAALASADLSEINAGIMQLTKSVSDMAGLVGSLATKLDVTTKELADVKAASALTVEQKAESLILAKIAGANGGFVPSQSDKNLTDANPKQGTEPDWFATAALGVPVGSAGGV